MGVNISDSYYRIDFVYRFTQCSSLLKSVTVAVIPKRKSRFFGICGGLILIICLAPIHLAFAELSSGKTLLGTSQNRIYKIAETIVFFRSMEKYCKRFAIKTDADKYLNIWLPRFGVAEHEFELGGRYKKILSQAKLDVENNIDKLTLVGWCLNNFHASKKLHWLEPYISTDLPIIESSRIKQSIKAVPPSSSFLVLVTLRKAEKECRRFGFEFKPRIWKDLAKFLYNFSEKKYLTNEGNRDVASRLEVKIRKERIQAGNFSWCSKAYFGFYNKNFGELLVSRKPNVD